MTDKPENPLAFPYKETNDDGTHFFSHSGMTLRDYFAAAALQGMLARDFYPSDSGNSHHSHAQIMPTDRASVLVAERAYKYAEAMLEARVK